MIYAALTDGTVNPRAREWRMPLVRMLVDGTPGTDFDCVYRLLLRGFGGNDERTKIRALTKWAEANLPPREAADVYRAETRYWLNLGDAVMTVDAAGRMERARPDYAVRARRLSALAHAMSGELEKAKAEIARSRAECSPMGAERHELLYLEAWIALQEGDVDQARQVGMKQRFTHDVQIYVIGKFLDLSGIAAKGVGVDKSGRADSAAAEGATKVAPIGDFKINLGKSHAFSSCSAEARPVSSGGKSHSSVSPNSAI
jgi:hypothetical protein